MNWFNNLKIKSKLLTTFAIPTLIIIVVGYFGYSGMDSIMGDLDELYADRLVPIRDLNTATRRTLESQILSADLFDQSQSGEKNMIISELITHRDETIKIMNKYRMTYLLDEEKTGLKKFDSDFESFIKLQEQFLSYINQQNYSQAMELYDNDYGNAIKDVAEALTILTDINTSRAEQLSEEADESGKMAEVYLFIFILIGAAMAVLLAFFVSSKISKPIHELELIADKIALGDVELDTSTQNKIFNDEIGSLKKAFNKMTENIKEISAAALKISEGNLNFNLAPKSEKDVLSNSLLRSIASIKNLVQDANELSIAAVEGKLKQRADVTKHFGDYKKIIEGINGTLDAIIAPFNSTIIILEKLAQGDLTARMESDCTGDYEAIKKSLNTVAESLNNAIFEVSEAVAATASAANEISSSTEEMAAGAQESSQQASEVASAVEQMTKTILETTRNTAAAAEASKNAGKVAAEGGKVVEDTINGMNQISEAVKKSGDTVLELGKSSDKIGEIVQVIDDIADQTNLLALNAAIEAARAGEQGRGFAVVADEVRKLAERTTNATKEIATMIRQIQKDTSEAVESMQQGREEVEKGKHLAVQSGESLEEIIHSSNKVADIIAQVAAASEEQSSASEQISKNIEGISSVTNESASGIQQIAQATEDLSRLTLNLQNLISNFKIEETNKSAAAHVKERTQEGKSNLYVKHNGSLHHERV